MRSLRSVIAAMIPALYMIAVVDELVNVMKADAWRRGDWKGGRDTNQTERRRLWRKMGETDHPAVLVPVPALLLELLGIQ